MDEKDCKHNNLIRIVNEEEGGPENSKVYQCQECKTLLTVDAKPVEITVSYGRPDDSKTD
jgi:hypothetical protein